MNLLWYVTPLLVRLACGGGGGGEDPSELSTVLEKQLMRYEIYSDLLTGRQRLALYMTSWRGFLWELCRFATWLSWCSISRLCKPCFCDLLFFGNGSDLNISLVAMSPAAASSHDYIGPCHMNWPSVSSTRLTGTCHHWVLLAKGLPSCHH